MAFWFYMLLIDLLIPAIMFFTGLWFRKRPPEKVSFVYGYRTRRSMKNRETWIFANRYMGNIWYRWGMILLPLSAIAMLFVWEESAAKISTMATVVCLAQLIPVLASIFPVEKALREHFDDQGNPIEN